ncbi:hypothetical protein CRG98_019234 [Punica granatum]|uniref:Uncharacterized protein n=1 Tax=Punica granatum TaxID=22663 RepID=A0A2I0JVN2_PUNGR|nr:hypothetical protein CRG98_019234 [Punica granatum]
MEAGIGHGKGQQASRGKARRGETSGSKESATLSGSTEGVCNYGMRLQQKISRTVNNPGNSVLAIRLVLCTESFDK